MGAALEIKDNLGRIADSLSTLARQELYVGVPESSTDRQSDPADKSEEIPGITNAALAYIHDSGSPEAGIPPRPFLVPGVNSVRDTVISDLSKAAKEVLDPNADKIRSSARAKGIMSQLGIKLTSAIRNYITQGDNLLPLAEATLENRRRKGRTGTRPLVDTAQLVRAINYVLRERGGK